MAIAKMESFFRDNNVDLNQFAKYLNEKAFKDFFDNHNRKSPIFDQTADNSASAIELLSDSAAFADEAAKISRSLSRIEMRLFALEQRNTNLSVSLASPDKKPYNLHQ